MEFRSLVLGQKSHTIEACVFMKGREKRVHTQNWLEERVKDKTEWTAGRTGLEKESVRIIEE